MYQCILRSHTADAEHRANSGTTVPPAGGNQCTVSEHAFRLTAKFFTGGGGGVGGRGKRGGKNNFKGGRL